MPPGWHQRRGRTTEFQAVRRSPVDGLAGTTTNPAQPPRPLVRSAIDEDEAAAPVEGDGRPTGGDAFDGGADPLAPPSAAEPAVSLVLEVPLDVAPCGEEGRVDRVVPGLLGHPGSDQRGQSLEAQR